MSRFSFSVANHYVKILRSFELRHIIGLGGIYRSPAKVCGISSNYSSSANREPLGKGKYDDDNSEELEEDNSENIPSEELKTKQQQPTPIENVTEKKKESITERLMRMSGSLDKLGSSPSDDYTPTSTKQRKPLDEYSRFEYSSSDPRGFKSDRPSRYWK